MKPSTVAIALGVTELCLVETDVVHVHRQHPGRLAGPALSQDVNDVEVCQRPNQDERRRRHDAVAQLGQGHVPERLSHVRAVDASGVVELGRYSPPPCLKNQSVKGHELPGDYHDDREEREVGLPSQSRLRKCMWAWIPSHANPPN